MIRPEITLLAELVPPRSRVLDLGCGNGDLLGHLIATRGCRGTGVDIDNAAVLQAIGAGLSVIELDLDTQLGEFADHSYDMVILSRTLQMVHRPEEVLAHMARIGTRMIVSMPNFGLWRHRLRLLRGRMPRSRDLPYHWYDSPNVHHATLDELEQFLQGQSLRIETRVPLAESGGTGPLVRARPNLFAGAAIYRLVSASEGAPGVA